MEMDGSGTLTKDTLLQGKVSFFSKDVTQKQNQHPSRHRETYPYKREAVDLLSTSLQ